MEAEASHAATAKSAIACNGMWDLLLRNVCIGQNRWQYVRSHGSQNNMCGGKYCTGPGHYQGVVQTDEMDSCGRGLYVGAAGAPSSSERLGRR